MKFDFIIVGQGLAGSLLAYELLKSGKKILLIDEDKEYTSSKIAAGIILPITGRRLVKTWKADTLIPFAKNFYNEIGKSFNETFFYELPVLEIFSSVKNRNDWQARSGEPGYEKYIGEEINADKLKNILETEFGGIVINNSGFLDVSKLIETLKKYFLEKDILKSAIFSFDDLKIKSDGVEWKNHTAAKIIFCDGHHVTQNSYFKLLPFLPAKGEILKIFSLELPQDYIINHGMYILPLGNHEFKVGATYQWDFKDDKPSPEGKQKTELFLRNFLKIKFEIISHEAAIRPTVQDRRPIIDLHPEHSSIGIFNGLGTKGVMLAPYFANQLSNFLNGKGEIDKEVNLKRFKI